MDLSPELARLVHDELQDQKGFVLPVMPFSGYSETGDLDKIVQEAKARLVLARCQAFTKEGYVTAIGMPFDEPQAQESAQAELNDLRPEILLFAQFLGEIRFRYSKESDQTWTREERDGLNRVLANGRPIGEWRVFRAGGAIPKEIREPDEHEFLDYEIVVAVPVKDKKGRSTVPGEPRGRNLSGISGTGKST